ncbi:hypothetical protein [Deinococcus hopiensis]|uniref:Uncharacterized protein n=1 Tax=Deinococcus hopiensis KR-140 TaxID=695939 RepID=A0A1W1VWD1_9DEIO|nr:hypothetical protein [Deinococcus hopiensis]SMB97560.1 hypothetical protein SAMN00790413_06056 [Deinococcus hopiensis KR-140]
MQNRNIAHLFTAAGAISILGSIAIWASQGGQGRSAEERAHGERFGIFVGLWAPTFFVLANHFNKAAPLQDEKP